MNDLSLLQELLEISAMVGIYLLGLWLLVANRGTDVLGPMGLWFMCYIIAFNDVGEALVFTSGSMLLTQGYILLSDFICLTLNRVYRRPSSRSTAINRLGRLRGVRRPTTCIGCKNYYGSHNIVCGIHPYGYGDEGDKCPDHKS